MRLRNKIHFYSAFIFISLLIFMNITVYFLFKNLLIESEIKNANNEIQSITAGIIQNLHTFETNDLLRAYVPTQGAIEIISSDGTKLSSITSPTETQLMERISIYLPSQQSQSFELQGTNYYFQTIPIV